MDSRDNLVHKAKAAREERARQKVRDVSVIIIQAWYRGVSCRKRLIKDALCKLHNALSIEEGITAERFILNTKAFILISHFFYFVKSFEQDDLDLIVKYVLQSLTIHCETQTFLHRVRYTHLALRKTWIRQWLKVTQRLLTVILHQCSALRPGEKCTDARRLAIRLNVIIALTDPSGWGMPKLQKQPGLFALTTALINSCEPPLLMCIGAILRSSLAHLSSTLLAALLTLPLRWVIVHDWNDIVVGKFLRQIMTSPGLIWHVQKHSIAIFNQHPLAIKCLTSVSQDSTIDRLECNQILCLVANIIHLVTISDPSPGMLDTLANVGAVLMQRCLLPSASAHSSMSQWHPLLGWFASQPAIDDAFFASCATVRNQLALLWKPAFVSKLFAPLSAVTTALVASTNEAASPKQSTSKSRKFFQKALPSLLFTSSTSLYKASIGVVDSAVIARVSSVCRLYGAALHTLTQLRVDILSGLTCVDNLVAHLWCLLQCLAQDPIKHIIEIMSSPLSVHSEQNLAVLSLFCDAAAHLITVLDDRELFDDTSSLLGGDQLISLAHFLNRLMFQVVWNKPQPGRNHPKLVTAIHALFVLVCERCMRRGLLDPAHLLIKDLKASQFFAEHEKQSQRALNLLQKLPHALPHRERVTLFRSLVGRDRVTASYERSFTRSNIITIRRGHIVEDGFEQLGSITPNAFKGVIRVKFVNTQGLDEAGIDQDGVFKEFLELSLRALLDPDLNLFRLTTADSKLYPSSTSYLQPNHISLFEYTGRLLGKAVYEGLIVDVQLAGFLLTNLVGRSKSSLYSCIDELPSLDPEFYKNLSFVKHYDGDVSDLGLTFSYDENIMGEMVTHELTPGGRATPVTDDNRILYIHLMAHFRMHTQIRDQLAALAKGFRALLKPEWLSYFSGGELQNLISGENDDVDVKEMRKYTQYYGGYHANHKVIKWFWSIVEDDFNREDRAQLLRFITSCSKPPLMGFSQLDPPLGIRCVEVAEEQDTGDTVGSIVRGFLSLNRREPVSRLPTSSTCFNLLKLPHYHNKSALREKLKYAIYSNTGFELS